MVAVSGGLAVTKAGAASTVTLPAEAAKAPQEEPLDGADLAAARRLQAHRFILANLSDPRLSAAAVAAALHISRRSLYSSMPAAGSGVAAHIRRQRLQRARAMLLDPAQTQPIAQIAAAVGLPNAAHFSRLFRAEYGRSPRDLRAHPENQDPAASP